MLVLEDTCICGVESDNIVHLICALCLAAGKTHTMCGPPRNFQLRGIIPRAIAQVHVHVHVQKCTCIYIHVCTCVCHVYTFHIFFALYVRRCSLK